MARRADALRRQGRVLGPLHGIPMLLKDNIDTGDRMQTTAGSFALAGRAGAARFHRRRQAARRRRGDSRQDQSLASGPTSARSTRRAAGPRVGGQTQQPLRLDRNPCGSSSGSGAAVSANFAAVSLGTETDGSIVCPANANGVVGIKPTVGLTSRAGVVPISHTQDTVGPHARTVADAAVVLSVIQSRTSMGAIRPPPACRSAGRAARGRRTFPRTTRSSSIATDCAARVSASRGRASTTHRVQVARRSTKRSRRWRRPGATLIDLDAAGFDVPARRRRVPRAVLRVRRRPARLSRDAHAACRWRARRWPTPSRSTNANAEREMPFFGAGDLRARAVARRRGRTTRSRRSAA